MSVIAGVGGELLCFLGEGKVQKLAGVDIKLLSLFSHLSCIDWLLEYLIFGGNRAKNLKYFVFENYPSIYSWQRTSKTPWLMPGKW